MDLITTAAAVYTPPAERVLHSTQAYLGDQRPPSTPVRLTQYDQTLPLLAARLLAGGQPYAVPEGGAVNVRLKKPDGTYVYNPALGVDSTRSTAYIAVTPQMTICAGRIAAVLEVVSDGGVACTGALMLDIEPNPVPESAIESLDEYAAVTQLAAAAAAAATAAAESEKSALASQTAAAGSASAAQDSAAAAQSSQTAAGASASAAAKSEEAAAQSRNTAAGSAAAAQSSQTAAETAQGKAETAQSAAQAAKTAAETAQGKAETAQAAAQTAKTAAETAQGKAETAQGKAEAAAASAAEYAGLSKGAGYGVEFSGSTSAGTRTGAAKDFVFTPATDTSEGQNDFDAVYPWAGMRRCCCTLNADGTVKVNAYKGQPGYIEDGTNGEVLVEVPLFYVKGMVDVDPQISMLPLPGFRAPRKFRNADGSLKQRCYLRAFPGYVGSDGKLHSIAGVVPSGNKTISAFLTAARQWGETYCIETSADAEVMLYLMIVVYGTRNFQAKINGCVSLYATNIAVTAAAESANIVTTAAGTLQVGDVISIGTGGENESVAYRRIVTAVDGAVAIFDGDPVTITTDHKVLRIMQATGTANDVLGTCGSRVSNNDGKHSFIFYGLENPLYGNQWRFECDWKLIDGVPYYCDDPTKYQWSSATDYTKLNTLTLPDGGLAVSLQADERAPWLQITAAVGGSSGTYLSDYFYINKSGVRIVRRGAGSNGGGYAGPFGVDFTNGASWFGWNSGGDLSIPG